MPGEFVGESTGVVRGLGSGDPFGSGGAQHAVARLGGFDAEPDREVGLAGAGWVEQDY